MNEELTKEVLCQEMREHLTGHLLPFWEKMKDETNGGYYGMLDGNLILFKEADKGCILNSRILWFFSNAYLTLGQEDLRGYADQAYLFLRDACVDRKRGGVYWSMTYDGKPADTMKHTYNLAFAVYALSTYYQAFQVKEALELAGELVDIMESRCLDDGGYLEALDIEFRPAINDKTSENGIIAQRTMNTLLHVLEAYTVYYAVTGQERIRGRLLWLLETFSARGSSPQRHRLEVFFDRDMNSLIDLHSFGHDIEAAWLMDRTLEVLGDKALTERYSPMLRDLERQIYREAFDGESLANECEKGKVDASRIWWVQAEGVVGFTNAYLHTGDTTYLQAAEQIWAYIKEKVIDSRPGSEWFWRLDPQGRPDGEKAMADPWKCPYHNGRMCMEMMKRMKQ